MDISRVSYGVIVDVAGTRLTLLPERAALWESQSTLFVADVHLGKAAAFRAQGAWMPEGANQDDLPALDRAIERTGARRVVILGDLWHAKSGRTAEEEAVFGEWCDRHATREVILVEGNHDRRSGPLPGGCGVIELPEGERLGPFILKHHPEPSPEGYVLAGHLHPGAILTGAGQRLRLPCFWFGSEVGILPAFGSLTGSAAVRPKRGDTVGVVADGRVIPFGPGPGK